MGVDAMRSPVSACFPPLGRWVWANSASGNKESSAIKEEKPFSGLDTLIMWLLMRDGK